jgi:hypothetical protein
MEKRFRRCGSCGQRNIPIGVGWPWWSDGQPVHEDCQKTLRDNERRERLHQLTGGAKIMEHEHLYHHPRSLDLYHHPTTGFSARTPISDSEKVEFVPLAVTRQLERSSRELAASNFELQNQNHFLMQAFRAFVLSTETFLESSGEHRGWSGASDLKNSGCSICLNYNIALNTAKFLVKP